MKSLTRHRVVVCYVVAIAAPLADICLGGNRFSEEAVQRGIVYITDDLSLVYGAGLAFADLDGDADTDIVTVGRSNDTIGLFENLGNGMFVVRTITGVIVTRPSGVTAADYDGDDDLDLYIAADAVPNRLLRNDGNLTFTDVSVAAGVDDSGAAHGCSWGDYDRDGWLDLYVANRTTLDKPELNRLYHNNGDGTFTNVAAVLGVERGNDPTFQASFFDFNRDGWPDLYICNDKGEWQCTPYRNHLFRNVGGSFEEITDASGTQACISCMGTAIADLDHDLTPDVYCSNVPAGNVLFLNQNNETFVEQAASAGVCSYAMAWGVEFFDFDNDGFQEIYVCNSTAMNRLYDWAGTMPFVDVAPTLEAGLGEPSFCVATGDIDNDGDLDILVQSSYRNVRLFVNHAGVGNHWARFRLHGDGPNTRGVGARVQVETPLLTQEQEVRAGTGFKSCSSYDPHFGLGAATSISRVSVFWPDGRISTINNPPIDSVVSIDQSLATLPCGVGADADGDGGVNGLDIQAFVARVTGQVTVCDGDLNGDGAIDAGDIALLIGCMLNDDCNS